MVRANDNVEAQTPREGEANGYPPEDAVEAVFGTGERARLSLSPAFVGRIREIVEDHRSGYHDLLDFFRAALRNEVGRAEWRLSNARRGH